MAVAAVAVGVASTAVSYRQQKKAAKAQKIAAFEQRKAEKVREKQSVIAAVRERRQQRARASVLQAQQQAQGFSSGIGQGSSVIQGTVGSLGTQLASNMGYSGQQQALSSQAGQFSQNSAMFQSQANQYNAQANMFSSLGGAFSSVADSSIFNTATPYSGGSLMNPSYGNPNGMYSKP